MSERLNWRVFIVCRDCGEQFECTSPSVSQQRVKGAEGRPGRLVLIGVPEVCPECRNLKLIPNKSEQS